MECCSPAFRAVVLEALDSPCRVLATVPARRQPFVAGLCDRADVTVLTLTPTRREQVLQDLLRLVTSPW